MKLIDREPTLEMIGAARFYKEGTHTLACAWRAMYDAAPDIQQEPIGYIDGHYGFVRTKEGINMPIGARAYTFPPDAQVEITRLNDLIEEQKGTITALNMALGGDDSTSTENLIDAHEVDYADQGLIPLVRELTKESVRLEDVVLFQKKAWASDLEELETLKDQLASSESSPITEEVEDILRSEIAKRDARIAELEERRCEICGYAEHHREHTGCLRVFVDEQAAEISRLKAVIAKCHSGLVQCKQWKEGVNTLTCHNHDAVELALAAIKEIEK